MKKRIFILYTGGTIGMRRSAGGYVPQAGLEAMMADMLPSHFRADVAELTLHEYESLIDSANIRPGRCRAGRRSRRTRRSAARCRGQCGTSPAA